MSFISDVQNTVNKVGGVIKKTYGPLSALESDTKKTNFTHGNLRYPLDVGDNKIYPHTVEFQCWIPKPTTTEIDNRQPPSAMPSSVGERATGLAARVINKDKITGLPTPKVNTNQEYNSRLVDFTRRADISDLIVMYNPAASWTDTVTNDYQNKSITEAMGKIGIIVEGGSSIMEALKIDKSLPATAYAAALEAITGAVTKKLGMDSQVMKDVGFQSQGYAINPQFEQIYGSTAMREFQFVFNMTPRNEKEAETCLNIVRRFKYHASPSYTGGGGRYITPPSYFDIEFKYLGSQNRAMPLISTCVLQKIDVSYAGGLEQFASFADGKPVQMTMTMQFVELEVMHKTLRDMGY
jgi:hypothetical protein